MGKNDTAWQALFEKYGILRTIQDNGSFFISANKIKEFREPRLMTKFDHRVNLPVPFSENGLAILPVSRSEYMISTFNAYQQFEDSSNIPTQRMKIPSYIQSLMPKFLVSEAIALNYANACGILSDFLEDSSIVPTVSGRMGSGIFSFNIDSQTGKESVSVHNSQIEIDAAYEGTQYLSLFEAKRDISEDFLVRQLYYPYRTWSNRVTKPVKTIFLVFSNGIFHLYEYKFKSLMDYNSLQLIKQKDYIISTEITKSDIEQLFNTVAVEPEPNLSFPQANSMARIINLIELLAEHPMTKNSITEKYAFNARQTNYYTDANRYLGLIEKFHSQDGNIIFQLSQLGRQIMSLDYRERQLAIVTQILKHKAFHDSLEICLRTGEIPDKNKVVEIMKSSNLYQVGSDSTFFRRASTIIRWITWIMKLIN